MKTNKPKKPRIVYKIVRPSLGKWISAYRWYRVSYYPVGEVVKPKVGKLFAFSTLKTAKEYLKTYRNDRVIFRSEAMGVTKASKVIPFCNNDSSVYEEYWKNGIKNLHIALQQPPIGTVLCDTIKLLKQIKYEIIP